MRRLVSHFKEGWLTFWYGEPCEKHPGHRMCEIDTEILTGCAMAPPMCELCWAEFEEKYGRL